MRSLRKTIILCLITISAIHADVMLQEDCPELQAKNSVMPEDLLTL